VCGVDLHASLSDEFDPHGEEDTTSALCLCSVSPMCGSHNYHYRKQ
jgi:hypothetical protein